MKTTVVKNESFLKKGRIAFFNIGLLVAVTLVLVAFKIPLRYEIKEEKPRPPKIDDGVITIMNPVVLEKNERIEQKKVKEIAKPKPVIQVVTTVSPDVKPVDNDIKVNDVNILPPDVEVRIATPEPGPAPVVNSAPVIAAEIMPEYFGGEKALMRYLSKAPYNRNVREMGEEGQVFVQFVVNKKGKVSDVKILRSFNERMNTEIVKYIEKMPDWSPGMQGKKEVDVIMVVPLKFTLIN